jgi:hypothetical protein
MKRLGRVRQTNLLRFSDRRNIVIEYGLIDGLRTEVQISTVSSHRERRSENRATRTCGRPARIVPSFFLVLILFALPRVGAAAQTPALKSPATLSGTAASAATPSAVPARSAQLPVFQDEGVFTVKQNGVSVGTEKFSIRSTTSGAEVHSDIDYHAGGKEVRQSADLRIGSLGDLKDYTWKEAGNSIHVAWSSGQIASHYQRHAGAARDYFFEMPAYTHIVDANFYAQWELLADSYDRQAGGSQKFPVFVPQSGDPTSLSIAPATPQIPKLLHLQAITDEATVDLYLEGTRLVRLVIPSASLIVERVP